MNALEAGDRLALNRQIKVYKYPNGAVNYIELLKIPLSDRLPSLVQRNGEERIHKILGAAIHLAMESLNLSQPLSAGQTINLVDEILDTANEDYLSLEDVVLFLQKLVRGYAGELYKHIDIATFMGKFEDYREQRHKEYIRAKEEKHIQHKAFGNNKNSLYVDKNKDIDPQTFFELLSTYQDSKNDAQ